MIEIESEIVTGIVIATEIAAGPGRDPEIVTDAGGLGRVQGRETGGGGRARGTGGRGRGDTDPDPGTETGTGGQCFKDILLDYVRMDQIKLFLCSRRRSRSRDRRSRSRRSKSSDRFKDDSPTPNA